MLRHLIEPPGRRCVHTSTILIHNTAVELGCEIEAFVFPFSDAVRSQLNLLVLVLLLAGLLRVGRSLLTGAVRRYRGSPRSLHLSTPGAVVRRPTHCHVLRRYALSVRINLVLLCRLDDRLSGGFIDRLYHMRSSASHVALLVLMTQDMSALDQVREEDGVEALPLYW